MPACTCGWGGDYSGRETPVPIPNTVVKPFSSDDTAGAALWENRTLPLHPPVEAGFSCFAPYISTVNPILFQENLRYL